MDPEDFARRFEDRFRQIYGLAARRVRDKRDLLPTASIAFLTHLAAAGPLTLTELAQHFQRAPSTLSEMVDQLEAKGILLREPDPTDRRRSLIWLTADGRARLAEELSVLDIDQLQRAATQFGDGEQAALLAALDAFIAHLRTTGERK